LDGRISDEHGKISDEHVCNMTGAALTIVCCQFLIMAIHPSGQKPNILYLRRDANGDVDRDCSRDREQKIMGVVGSELWWLWGTRYGIFIPPVEDRRHFRLRRSAC
jgi:hypothetical protein